MRVLLDSNSRESRWCRRLTCLPLLLDCSSCVSSPDLQPSPSVLLTERLSFPDYSCDSSVLQRNHLNSKSKRSEPFWGNSIRRVYEVLLPCLRQLRQLARYRRRRLPSLECVGGSKLRRGREKNGENGKSAERRENVRAFALSESSEKRRFAGAGGGGNGLEEGMLGCGRDAVLDESE